MRLLFAFIAGSTFGIGLLISGMTDTSKVQGWLDIFGAWDPTLAFVLGGAILPMTVTWRIVARRQNAVLGNPLPAPPRQGLDTRIIVGSLSFGAGWGLVGLCPGPAMASLTFGGSSILIFFAAMAAGMGLARLVQPGWISRLSKSADAGRT